MRQLFAAAAVSAVLALPLPALAGGILEFSAGSGYVLKPSEAKGRTPTMIMLAPGYGLGEMLRAELGFGAALPDVKGSKFQLELRPMLVIDPPLLPFYVRLIAGIVNLTDSDTRAFAYGGALGVGGSLMGIGIFAEAAYVPRSVNGVFLHTAEARAGAYYAF